MTQPAISSLSELCYTMSVANSPQGTIAQPEMAGSQHNVVPALFPSAQELWHQVCGEDPALRGFASREEGPAACRNTSNSSHNMGWGKQYVEGFAIHCCRVDHRSLVFLSA